MSLSVKETAKYIQNGGVICPFCKIGQIEGIEPLQVDAEIAWQHVQCDNCEKEWDDVYKLSDVDDQPYI